MSIFYRPLIRWQINQKFGQNKACVDNATSSKVINCDGLNPPQGYRSVYGNMKGHNGLDLDARNWDVVYAAREGLVIEKETETSRGLGIGILHGPYNGKFYKTRYWHLIAIDVNYGDFVKTGQMIGYADTTGFSSAPHLHFEIKETDSKGNTLNNDNGFFGAVDPEPLLFPTPARDVSLLNGMVERLASLVDKMADLLRKR